MALLVATGCAPRPRPTAGIELPDREECTLLPGEPLEGGTIRVGVTEIVDAGDAPAPRNDSERLVFRQLYETLVEADCGGHVRPGLATSWTQAEAGRIWTFALRDGARFWNGDSVHAADVKESWAGTWALAGTRAAGRIPWAWVDPRSDSVIALDERHLVVRLTAPVGESPALFADPALAVGRRGGEGGWAEGTETVRTWMRAPGRLKPFHIGSVDCGRSLWAMIERLRPPWWDRLSFLVRPGADLRDLGGADALLVRDRDLVDYFATAPKFELTPLPWDRLYVLLSPGAVADWGRGGGPVIDLEPDDRDALARDAVASEAKPAASLLQAADLGGPCFFPGVAPEIRDTILVPVSDEEAARRARRRIAHAAGDLDARRLAERLAALGRGLAAASLPAAEFGAALEAGSETAFVARLERQHASGCLELAALVQAAPWLLALANDGEPAELIAARLVQAGAAIPLVTTRSYLAALPELSGVRSDYDGALRFDKAGWSDLGPLPVSHPDTVETSDEGPVSP